MPDLIRNQTTDTISTGVSLAGPCTVLCEGSTFDGFNNVCNIQISTDDTNYGPVKEGGTFYAGNGSFTCNTPGTYYLRAALSGSGGATDVTVVAIQ